MVDIHTVGAGGGSLARRDSGGALLVGPRSAGADPGPGGSRVDRIVRLVRPHRSPGDGEHLKQSPRLFRQSADAGPNHFVKFQQAGRRAGPFLDVLCKFPHEKG